MSWPHSGGGARRSAAPAPANPGAAKPQPPSSVSPSGVQTRNASADFMLGGEVAGTP